MSVLELCDREIASVPLDATCGRCHQQNARPSRGRDVRRGRFRIPRRRNFYRKRDVLRKMALSRTDPQTTSVRELMTTPVEMATRRTGPGEALTTMLERHFRHLPVADDNGKLLGILSIRNLLEWRVEDLSHELDALEQYVSNDGPGG